MTLPYRLAIAAREALVRDGSRIVLVGAGGWIGRATLALLADALGDDVHNRVVCFGSNARRLAIRDDLAFDQKPLAALAGLAPEPTILFHLAFLTKDKVAGMDEAEYCAANRALSRQVIEALDPIGVDRLFIASSGAARHADDDAAAYDLRLYGRLKKDDEERFAAWALARPDLRRVAICRIFSLTGPYINKHDTYALASFILDALAGRAIDVRAPIPVQRSYVALRELISLVLVLLIDGREPVMRFDSGGTPMELGDVAARVASVLGAAGVNRAPITGTGENVYVGDAATYLALLADAAIEPVPFDDQIAETAAYISSTAVQ